MLILRRIQKKIISSLEYTSHGWNSVHLFLFTSNTLNVFIWHWFTCLVMFGHLFQNTFVVNPVFHHLTWHLDEISFNRGSRKSVKVCFRAHGMHNMSKFMEESDDFAMIHKWWFTWFWCLEVGDHRNSWCSDSDVNFGSFDKLKNSCMIVFIFSWV